MIFPSHDTIAIDLDEVLASTFHNVLVFAHSQGKLLAWKTFDDMRTHDHFDAPETKITKEEEIALWDDYWHDTTLSPRHADIVDGAQEGIAWLQGLGKKIIVITARNEHVPIQYQGTKEWIQKYFPALSGSVYFSSHMSDAPLSKADICREHGATLLIDDNMRNAKECVEAGIVTILLTRPWNRDDTFSHPLLHRVDTWEDIISLDALSSS